jgi:L-asparagine transporter-like permease
MRSTQTSSTIRRGSTSPAHVVLRWVINLAWIVVWIVLYFMCINVFGDTVAFIGIPVLIVVMVIVWFATERRNRQHLEEEV